jgi:hypothetical protein
MNSELHHQSALQALMPVSARIHFHGIHIRERQIPGDHAAAFCGCMIPWNLTLSKP